MKDDEINTDGKNADENTGENTEAGGGREDVFGPEDVYLPTDGGEDAGDAPEDADDADDAGDADDFDGDSFEERYRRRIDEEKRRKRLLIYKIAAAGVCVLAAAALAMAFYHADSGMIGAYKENFARNFQKLFPQSEQQIDIGATQTDTGEQGYVDGNPADIRIVERTADNVKVVPFDGAADGGFAKYSGGLVCSRANYLCLISSDGETEWELNTPVSDPILSVDGKYIAIGSEGGTKLCLYDGSELLFDTDTAGGIRSVRVSAGGDVIIVTDRENYKGAVEVYNKSGQRIFSWASGQNDVISADISSASRRAAVLLLNADRQVYSIIRVFDINSGSSSEMAFDDTLLFRVDYTGDTITGFGDNSLVCMTSTGRVINDRRFDMVDIIAAAGDEDGNKLLYIDSAGVPVLQVYGRKGVLDSETAAGADVGCIDINGHYVLYSDGRSVLLRRAGSDRVNEYVATMDILKLVLINNSSYAVIHSNGIELVTL